MTQGRRILSVLLAWCVMLGLLPNVAFAANGAAAFSDVDESEWFYDDVNYACEHNLMNGTSATTFAPQKTTTRAMIVTILHRLEGTPSASDAGFSDVGAGEYFTAAVNWAAERNIVNGYGNNTFGPDNNITREQMAAILYRYASYKNYDVTKKADCSTFSDANQISSYATDALSWCNAEGLITGTGGNKLAPKGNAVRAQVAAILTRFCKNVAPSEPQGEQTPSQDEQTPQQDEQTPEKEAKTYTVTFNLNTGVSKVYQTTEVDEGKTVTEPSAPTRTGYEFKGWYTAKSKSKGTPFDFNSAITEDITLYAQWASTGSGSGHSGSSSSGGSSSGSGGSSSGSGGSYPVPNNPGSVNGPYTVSFNSNGGSAVASQRVEKDGKVTRPADPTWTGHTFVGWYTDSGLTHLYNFESAVTSNMTLYARWNAEGEVIATYLDETDPDVEIYSFSTEDTENKPVWDIPVGETKTVTFTAEIFDNIGLSDDDVSVVDETDNVVATMQDDGNGVYTAQAQLQSDDVKATQYFVKCKDAKSDGITIGYYKDYTDEDLAALEGVINQIQTAMQEYVDENGYLKEGQNEAAVTALEGLLNQLKDDGTIASFTKDATGIYTIVMPSGATYEYSFKVAEVDAAAGIIISNQPFKNTYRQDLQNQSDDATDGSARKVAATFADDYRFTSTTTGNEMNDDANDDNYDDDEVSLDAVKNIANADVVSWHGHGGYSRRNGSYMGTGTRYTRALYEEYEADLQAGRLVLSGDRFWFTGGFVQKYVGDLSGHFLYLGTCSSGKDMVDGIAVGNGQRYELAQSFLDKGATAVIANTATISTNYNTKMEQAVFARLCETNADGKYYTLSEALDYARSTVNPYDWYTYTKYGETEPAYARIFPCNRTTYEPEAAAANYKINEAEVGTGTASGTVKDASNGQAVANALVRVYTTNGSLVKSIRTDANGNYSIELPAGTYIIKVTAGNYKSVKAAVTINEGENTYTETLLLLESNLTMGSAKGRITNAIASEQGVADVRIRIRLGWNNRQGVVLNESSITTDENGYYEISNFPAGIYTIEYSKSGYVTGYRNIIVMPVEFAEQAQFAYDQQNAIISPLTSEDEYRIVLSWRDHPSDLDAHLTGPSSNGGRFHLYYPNADANGGSPEPDYFTLDLDNTTIRTRSDPETVTILKQLDGKYVYSVHDFSNGGSASSTSMATSNAVVTVYKGSTEIVRYNVPTDQAGTIWNVFELDGDTITPLNRFSNGYSQDPSFDPYNVSSISLYMDTDANFTEQVKEVTKPVDSKDKESGSAETSDTPKDEETAKDAEDSDIPETTETSDVTDTQETEDTPESTDTADDENAETAEDAETVAENDTESAGDDDAEAAEENANANDESKAATQEEEDTDSTI